MEDGSLGTSSEKIYNARDEVYSDDGVLVLVEMGSAAMTAELVIEEMPGRNIRMLDCPLVEGAILAAVELSDGHTLETLIERIEDSRVMMKF